MEKLILALKLDKNRKNIKGEIKSKLNTINHFSLSEVKVNLFKYLVLFRTELFKFYESI